VNNRGVLEINLVIIKRKLITWSADYRPG